MSAAALILGFSAAAISATHDDALVVMPQNVPVTGYAEEMEADPEEKGARRRAPLQLHTADDLVTHIVHIRRELLAGVPDLKKVNLLLRADSSNKRYRVRHFTDDPGRPETDFYCSLATA